LMFSAIRAACLALAAITLSGCLTSETGDADRMLPPRQLNRLVAFVAGPAAVASNLQTNISGAGADLSPIMRWRCSHRHAITRTRISGRRLRRGALTAC